MKQIEINNEIIVLPTKYDYTSVDIKTHHRALEDTASELQEAGIYAMAFFHPSKVDEKKSWKRPVQDTIKDGVKYEDNAEKYNTMYKKTLTKRLKVDTEKYNIGYYCGNSQNLTIIDFDWFVKDKTAFRDNILQMKQLYEDIITGIKRSGQNVCVVKSQSGGRHIYCQYAPLRNVSNAHNFVDGVDVRSFGGFIVGIGSEGEYGKYELIEGSVKDLPQLPDFIVSDFKPMLKIKKKKKGAPSKTLLTPQEEQSRSVDECNKKIRLHNVKYVLDNLPVKYATDYTLWRNVMWILGGIMTNDNKADILELAVGFSSRSTDHPYDDERYKQEFIEMTNYLKYNHLRIQSLFYYLKKDNKEAFDALQKRMIEDELDGVSEVFSTNYMKSLDNYLPQKMYFENYYRLVCGDNSIYTIKPKILLHQDVAEFFKYWGNIKGFSEISTGDETIVVRKTFKELYLEDENRLNIQKAGIYFHNQPAETLNLYNGLYAHRLLEDDSITPDFEKAEIFDIYFQQLVEDPKQAEMLYDCLANLVLTPHKRTGIAINLVGPSGAGKSSYTKIYQHLIDGTEDSKSPFYNCATMDKYTAQFNYNMLNGKLVCVIEEMDKFPREWEKFKDMVKQDIITTEKKGVDAMSIQSYIQWIGVSNNPFSVPNPREGDRSIFYATITNNLANSNTNKKAGSYLMKHPSFWTDFNNALICPKALKAFVIKLKERDGVAHRSKFDWERLCPEDAMRAMDKEIPAGIQALKICKKTDNQKTKKYNSNNGYYLFEKDHFIKTTAKYWKSSAKNQQEKYDTIEKDWRRVVSDMDLTNEIGYFEVPKGDTTWICFNYDKFITYCNENKLIVNTNKLTEEQENIFNELFNMTEIDSE